MNGGTSAFSSASDQVAITVLDPLFDTTPVSTVAAAAGNETGNVVLATFTDGQASAMASNFTPIVTWGGALVGTPTVSVDLVGQFATYSTWEVVGSATYATTGEYAAAVTINDADGTTIQTSNTSFNVGSANAPASLAFAGEYVVSTTGNSALTLASITQSGDQCTLATGVNAATLTVVSTPGQLLAGGTVVATYANSSITFSAGIFAGQTWTKLDLPADFTNQSGAAVHVIENGTSVTFVDKFGDTSPGIWTSPIQLSATAWGEAVTIGLGKLLWQDGSYWSENLVLNGTNDGSGAITIAGSPSQVSVFDFLNSLGKPVHLVQTSTTNVIFIDSTGHISLGTFIDAAKTQLTTPYFPNDIATIGNDFSKMTWADGFVWTKASTSLITVTDYTNQNGVPVHLVQNGTSQVAFVDGLGRTSLGTMLSPTTAVADLYPSDVATFSGITVTWQDKFVWTQTNALPLMTTFTDTNGAVSHLKLTSATTLLGLDGALKGFTATRLNGKLFWSNGVVWDTIDFDALNALFEMGTGFP